MSTNSSTLCVFVELKKKLNYEISKIKKMEEQELKTALTHWLICKKDFDVFKKGEYYWLELLVNGNLYGRSDNVKEVEIKDFSV